ncbi:hypothetical protein Tco_0676886 [Tanacetum coccineum]
MLEKGCYDTWQSRILLHFEGKEHGEMLLDSIFSRPFEFKDITIPANEAIGWLAETRMQTLKDLKPEERIRKECDIRAANIIFHRLPNDIYTLLNHNKKAYDIWLDTTRLHVNTKFVNHLQPEWSKYVIGVKQARNLHEVSFD